MSILPTLIQASLAGAVALVSSPIHDSDWRQVPSSLLNLSVEVPCSDSQIADAQARHTDSDYKNSLICEQPEIGHWFILAQLQMDTPPTFATVFDSFFSRATKQDGAEHVHLTEFSGRRAFAFESELGGSNVRGRVVEMGSNAVLIQFSGFNHPKTPPTDESKSLALGWSARFLSSLKIEDK